MKCAIALLLVVASVSTSALADPPSGLSLACGKAYEAMIVCRRKFALSDAPVSMKQQFDSQYAKQMADTLKMWRAMRGVEGVEKSCKQIAENPACAD